MAFTGDREPWKNKSDISTVFMFFRSILTFDVSYSTGNVRGLDYLPGHILSPRVDVPWAAGDGSYKMFGR